MSSDPSVRTQLVIYYYMGLDSRHSLDNHTVSTRADKHKAWWDHLIEMLRITSCPIPVSTVLYWAAGSWLYSQSPVPCPGRAGVVVVSVPGPDPWHTGDCLASGSAQFLPGCSSGQCRCQHTATHHTSGQLIVNTASCHWQVVARTCSRMCECESFAS